MAKGVCTSCGLVVEIPHACSDKIARLVAIDREVGPRAIREILLELGKKGFGNKIEILEQEAITLRQEIAALGNIGG